MNPETLQDTDRPRGGPAPSTGRGIRLKVALSALAVLIFFGAAEVLLRAAGRPTGKYRFMFAQEQLLYEPSTRIESRFGPIAYAIETNSLGMRSDEVSAAKPRGVVRIAAIGDSATDGFFVDNEQTYPAILQRSLRLRGHSVEVMNAGYGGSSIGREFRVLRGVTHLSPDLAVLTFCTNDIAEILGKDPEQLARPPRKSEVLRDGVGRVLVGYTAIGEFLLDAWIRFRSRAASPQDVAASDRTAGLHPGEDLPQRYRFAGGDVFSRNVREFRKRFAESDGLVLGSEFSPQVERSVGHYLQLLDQVHVHCRNNGIDLVLTYLPAYPEIYDRSSPMEMRARLESWSSAAGVPFLDLTPAFRERGARTPLHLTPVDFHPNPAGNRVLAEAVADFLVRNYPQFFPGRPGS